MFLALVVLGCGEDDSDVLQEGAVVGMLADAKYPDAVAAAPSLPAGTPSVKEVSFYHDWKLTKPVTAPVSVGEQIFIHLTFSEPMKHVVSDGKEARPILYYKRAGKGEELVRFKMAAHGAGGEDFVSGDAKPYQSGTDDYLCKYTVVPEDAGKGVAFMVGRWSADLQGTLLSAFYRHGVPLEVAKPTPLHPMLVEEPVRYYYLSDSYSGMSRGDPSDVEMGYYLPPSAWVHDFHIPYKRHTPPRSGSGDFVGRVCMPVSGVGAAAWKHEGAVAPVSGAVVTITDGARTGEQVLTDEGGYFLFKDAPENRLYLRVERAYLEPKEVIVFRDRPTELQEIPPNRVFESVQHNRDTPDNAPGTVLVGLRWPDAVRFVLENELLPHDLLLVLSARSPEWDAAGLYSPRMHVEILPARANPGRVRYDVLFHELGHARQHVDSILHGVNEVHIAYWTDRTPEAKSYQRAWDKDLQEVPPDFYGLYIIDDNDHYSSIAHENSAELFSCYWQIASGPDWYQDGDVLEGLRRRAPNRMKWVENYLNTKYD